MSFFQSLGQQTERIKQKFTSDTVYECRSCETTLNEAYETCPHCESNDVAAVT
jgi:rubrerythrin